MLTSLAAFARPGLAVLRSSPPYEASARKRSRRVHERLPWVLALACICSAGSARADAELLGASVITDWRSLPIAHEFRLEGFSSHDPGTLKVDKIDRHNKDFNNFLAVCGERPAVRDQLVAAVSCDVPDEQGGYLIASADGPGLVSRIFFPATASAGFGAERIRIFIDDLTRPAIDASLLDWCDPAQAPPLTTWTSGALVSRAPITYQHALRIVLDDLEPTRLYYYQVDVQHGQAAETRPLSQLTADFAQLRERIRTAADADARLPTTARISAHEEAVLFDELGAGTLLNLALHLPQPAWHALQSLSLRITWDDADSPAIDLPLGALAGYLDRAVGFETVPLSATVNDEAVDLTIALPMPFFKRARISLVNDSDMAHGITAQLALSRSAPDPRSEYLHVQRSQTHAPFVSGQRHPIATITGEGKYVGTLAQLRGQVDRQSATPFPLGFLEGDERVVVDGTTALEGTGTEDYFDAGWYFANGLFSRDFSALIDLSSDDATQRGSASMLRWHVLADAIEFHASFEMSLEYGANRPDSASDYVTSAFYYLAEP